MEKEIFTQRRTAGTQDEMRNINLFTMLDLGRGLRSVSVAFSLSMMPAVDAQQFVVNGSFEDNSAVPTGEAQWWRCNGWNNVNMSTLANAAYATPDYYHEDATIGNYDLPTSARGTISPHTGSAIMGLLCFNQVGNAYLNFREYLSSQLASPMVVGDTYIVSFWMHNAEATTQRRYGSTSMGSLGIHFSTSPLSQPTRDIIPVTPQLVVADVAPWSDTWTLHTFTYTATSAWEYITIGNYTPTDLQARTVQDPTAQYPTGSYYFIDDISVELDCPLAMGTDTQQACNSYTWIDGVTYTTSNNTATYTFVGGSAAGCDSIVTLDLTINNSVLGTDTQAACGSYTWLDGVTYTTSNNTATFTIVGGAVAGCDSIVTLDLTIVDTTTGTDTQTTCDPYTWIDGVTYTASNNTATFTIVGGSVTGCDSIVTLDLTIYPVLAVDLGGDTGICGDSIVLSPGPGFSSYLWSTGSTSPSITVSSVGNYSVDVTDLNGCGGSDRIEVFDDCPFSVQVPNVFTPNGDGSNETFGPIITGSNVANYAMYIYNRWGQMIFESNSRGLGWNGRSEGGPVPDGVYYYVITFDLQRDLQKKEYTGHVTLLR